MFSHMRAIIRLPTAGMGEAMPLEIIRADIVNMRVDAIVNAANSRLREGTGVCASIFSGAGASLQEECERIGGCSPGQAVITSGHGLPANHIIHTTGPVWCGGSCGEEQVLASCYRESLNLALLNKVKTIAFPLIAAGARGFPKELALRIAVDTIGSFLLEHDMDVKLVVFDQESVAQTEKLFSPIKQYIDDHYVQDHSHREMRRQGSRYDRKAPIQAQFQYSKNMPDEVRFNKISADRSYGPTRHQAETDARPSMLPPVKKTVVAQRTLDGLKEELDETFSQSVFRLIDARGLKDSDVYRRANIDRKLFSKIRGNINYHPRKQTALALAIALRLSLDETKDLIGRAGFALSRSSLGDLIVTYFIEREDFNIFMVNAALFEYGESLLTA
jgi:O-acetyl-ADP-ribose deacetylase